MGSFISAGMGGLGAYGTFADAATQEQMGDENRNAYNLAARDAIQRGRVAQQRAAIKAGQVTGQARTALATSGVDSQSGTALQDLGTTAGMGALDRLTIENNAAREAFGYKAKALQSWQQGQINSVKDFYGSITQDASAAGGGASQGLGEAKSLGFLGGG